VSIPNAVRKERATALSLGGRLLSTTDDGELIRRAVEGEERAFAALVERHAPVCLRYATRMLGSREDAEDVTQESMVRAFRVLHRFDHSTPFRSWLLAILVNRCRTSRGARIKREMRVTPTSGLFDQIPDPRADEGFDFHDAIGRALTELDVDQREAFLLKHVEELSYDEMSAITGAGISALKMRVKRACDRLRELLEDGDARHD
jgi:RNA polymerase sigma-70 factor, ECF subfamily